MDLEQFSAQVRGSASGKALEALTTSETGKALASRLDGAALEKAVGSGDAKVMAQMLRSVLNTPEGASFAREVKKAVEAHGG